MPNAQPGDIITFGAYPQTADGSDRTPIRWRVLPGPGGDLLLLSEYILDCKRYHGADTAITWRDCDLRRWLNEEFYNAAFDAAEQEAIRTTRCTGNGAGGDTAGDTGSDAASPDTEDKVFLLSATEVTELTAKLDDPVRARRRAAGTAFARVKKDDGCRLYVYDKGVKADYIVENGVEVGCSWWWLRTQGNTPARAVFVGMRSTVRTYGSVNLPYYGVRPAIKITL